MNIKHMQGDCRAILPTLPGQSVHCCVTSPPYFGLRDYGVDGQMGLEPTPDEFVAELVKVFREVKRVLRDDGTLWLNLGDSYCSQGGIHAGCDDNQINVGGAAQWRAGSGRADGRVDARAQRNRNGIGVVGLKPKDLIGIPWRVAFALQADGWYLRQDIIWHKPNPMPESVTDRCTKAHEYIFLLSKSARYYFDAKAIADKSDPKQAAHNQKYAKPYDNAERTAGGQPGNINHVGIHGRPGDGTRNKRSVWTVPPKPFKEAHFATFPPDLIEPCILAGCPVGGTVLDPFGGAGTTGLVADRLQRNAILIELNQDYSDMAKRRINDDRGGLFDRPESPTAWQKARLADGTIKEASGG